MDGRYRVQVRTQVAADFTPVDWPETKLAPWLIDFVTPASLPTSFTSTSLGVLTGDVSDAAIAAAVLSAVDPAVVVERAKALMADEEWQLALHVLDLVAGAAGDDPLLVEARTLKGDCAAALGKACPTFVSRSIYKGAAMLHHAGLRRASEAPDGPGAL